MLPTRDYLPLHWSEVLLERVVRVDQFELEDACAHNGWKLRAMVVTLAASADIFYVPSKLPVKGYIGAVGKVMKATQDGTGAKAVDGKKTPALPSKKSKKSP